MALSYSLLDASEADGGVASKRRWLQPKVVGFVAVLVVVCLSGLLLMPEATEPRGKSLTAPVFLGQAEKASTVATVKAVLAAWEEGAFLGKDALENAEKMVSSDFFIDASGPSDPGFKVYSGPKGLLGWMAFFGKKFTVTGIDGNVSAGDAPGQAFWAYSLDVVTPSKKMFTLKGVDDIRVNSAGLLSSITIYWDVKTTDKYLAECDSLVSPVAIAKSAAEAWEKGEYSGAHAMETAKKFFTEDLFLDVSGPNHPAFKVYKGPQGFLDWVAVLDRIANITATAGSFIAGPAPDKVVWDDSETWSSPTGKLFTMKNYDEFTVTEDGKISSFIGYWDVKTVNEYLLESKI